MLKAQHWSPDWSLESQNGLFMLGHSVSLRPIYINMGRKTANNNNKRESGSKASREKLFWSHRVFGDKREKVQFGKQTCRVLAGTWKHD